MAKPGTRMVANPAERRQAVARIDASREALLDSLSDLMTFGLQHEATIEGELVKANWPLTVRQAARVLGKRVSRCRVMSTELPFQDLMRRKLKEFRDGERPRNLATLASIRDHLGEDTAADRTVRVKAAIALEGADGKAGVTVTVNAQTNVISPGYVIRLPAKPDQAALDRRTHAPLIIDHVGERAAPVGAE